LGIGTSFLLFDMLDRPVPEPPENTGTGRPRNHWGTAILSMTTWAMTAAKIMVTAGLVTARNSSVKTPTRVGLALLFSSDMSPT
jgi:hypothetical protein